MAMQPAWRNLTIRDVPLLKYTYPPLIEPDVSWGALDTHGINGYLSLLMALGWWGEVALAEPSTIIDLSEWSRACLDVEWVIKRL